jgi:hypothetical protein
MEALEYIWRNASLLDILMDTRAGSSTIHRQDQLLSLSMLSLMRGIFLARRTLDPQFHLHHHLFLKTPFLPSLCIDPLSDSEDNGQSLHSKGHGRDGDVSDPPPASSTPPPPPIALRHSIHTRYPREEWEPLQYSIRHPPLASSASPPSSPPLALRCPIHTRYPREEWEPL